MISPQRKRNPSSINHSQFNLNAPEWTNRLFYLVLIISVLLIVLTQSSHLWDKYRVVPDVQNSYWMARYKDPTLFTTDYLFKHRLVDVQIMGLHLVLYPLSLGWGLLFYLTSFVIDHIWTSKWLIFILVPLSIAYLFKLAQLLVNNLAGVSLSLLFVFFILASSQEISPVTGLQRAFAIPLLIIFLYYLLSEQYIKSGMIIVMSALFYWPNVPLAVVTYGLSFIKIKPLFKVSLHITWSKLMPLFGSLLLSILILTMEIAVNLELFTSQSIPISQNPLNQTEGVAPMFISFPWLGRAGIFNTGIEVINFIVLLILSFLVYKVVGRQSWQRLPRVYWHLLIAGITMYIASFFVLFGLSSSALYFPSRYTRTTLILCAILFVGLNWGDFLTKSPRWFRRKSTLIIFFLVSLVLVFGLVYLFFPDRLLLTLFLWFIGWIVSGLVVVFGTSSLFLWTTGNKHSGFVKTVIVPFIIGIIVLLSGRFYFDTLGTRTLIPSQDERNIYEYVATLPKDTVLAGDPVIMSGIPLFSKRSVLFRDLYPNVNPNASVFIPDFFDAQYAESPEAVLNFCQRYQVSYFVLNQNHFTVDYLARQEFFYQPYNDKIIEMVNDRSEFILPHLNPLFTSGPYSVIKCDADTVTNN